MQDVSTKDPLRNFTVKTLARHWGVSPSHIYNLIHSNAIRHLRIGKTFRIPAEFVKAFEENALCQPMKNTDSGSIQTELFTSYGLKAGTVQAALKPSAFHAGQQLGMKQNSSALNSSQD